MQKNNDFGNELSTEGNLNEMDRENFVKSLMDPLEDVKNKKSFPVYVIMSLIDTVMDQMKSESHEFKKLI